MMNNTRAINIILIICIDNCVFQKILNCFSILSPFILINRNQSYSIFITFNCFIVITVI